MAVSNVPLADLLTVRGKPTNPDISYFPFNCGRGKKISAVLYLSKTDSNLFPRTDKCN